MSFVISAECWKLQINPTQKAVLMSIADMSNDQGYCWPSINHLSVRTCFSERAVSTAIKHLENQSILFIDRSVGMSNKYFIDINFVACLIAKQDEPTAGGSPPKEVHPRRRCIPTPAGGAVHPRRRCSTPPQEVHTNHKEQSINNKLNNNILETLPLKTKKTAKQNWLLILTDEYNIQKEVAIEFIENRKNKKATISKIVLNNLIEQSQILNITLDEAIKTMIINNWAGFKADWVKNQNAKNAGYTKPDTSFAAHQASCERQIANIEKFAPKQQQRPNDNDNEIIDSDFTEIL
jgi:DNA-binding transcriptional regulator YhcF (GntR family)